MIERYYVWIRMDHTGNSGSFSSYFEVIHPSAARNFSVSLMVSLKYFPPDLA